MTTSPTQGEHVTPQGQAPAAPADTNTASGAAPATGAVAGWQWVPVEPAPKMLAAAAIMRWRYDALLAAAPTPPTQAADSVLEDTARLDWLEKRGSVAIERCKYLGSDDLVIEVTPYNDDSYEGDTLRAAIDAAIAQQKGRSHE